MIRVEEALDKILSFVSVLEEEEKPILESLGQVLAQDITSPLDVPPADNSAMDGYAVQAASTSGASPSSPQVLKLVGEVAAGQLAQGQVGPATAMRIMTGAPLPQGADAVVPFEDTDEGERQASGKGLSHIGILRQASPGWNARRAGEDIARDSLVLEKGTELGPVHIGLLASLGQGRVRVIRRPRVAILATGDELTDVDQPLPPGRIYNSNTYGLAGQVLHHGGIPQILGIARDRASELQEKIHQGLDSDLLLTAGGVSKGDYDMVKDVLAQEGEVTFHTVRMRPGKPLAFGTFQKAGRRVPHLGLPGNPVSVMVTFELFARPAILKLMGKKNLALPTITAIMESAVKNTDGRRVFARVQLSQKEGRCFARLSGPQGSGILTSLALAHGLAIVPEDVAQVKEGDLVQVILLDWNKEVPCPP